MASSFRFHAARMRAACTVLADTMRDASDTAMQSVVDQAADDARALKSWRNPGQQTQTYPNGDEWEWTNTGMAANSIQGYVVGRKHLDGQPTQYTVSYKNRQPLRHVHATDDRVTRDYAARRDRVRGIITMNVAYAPYLQEWETREAGMPVTLEVLAFNWDRVYVPKARHSIETAMATVARRYR